MEYIIYLIPALLLIRLLNQYRVDICTLSTQNKLQALKHEVTVSYLNGKVTSPKDHVDHLNNIISKTSIFLPRTSIWVIMYTWKIKKVEERVEYIKSCKKELFECPELSKFYNRYTELSAKYVLNKSVFSLLSFSLLLFIGKNISSRFTRLLVRIKDGIGYNLALRGDNFNPTI